MSTDMTELAQDRDDALRWALLVPLKAPATAKSRLFVPSDLRAELVLAMACDTVAVAMSCPLVALVLIVADSAEGLEPLQRMGAGIVLDTTGQGLNAGLRHAAGIAAARDSGYGIASLVADVAALTVDQLTRTLAAAAAHERSYVPDAAGPGTTFVAARHWGSFLPEYGPGSRRRHGDAGFVELTVPDITGLRLDVDTIADLAAATAIGTGPRTTAVLTRSAAPRGGSR
jgi:2-phospho-L-lactate/phosphoenolpyruvate guanylyltransferase